MFGEYHGSEKDPAAKANNEEALHHRNEINFSPVILQNNPLIQTRTPSPVNAVVQAKTHIHPQIPNIVKQILPKLNNSQLLSQKKQLSEEEKSWLAHCAYFDRLLAQRAACERQQQQNNNKISSEELNFLNICQHSTKQNDQK